MTPLIRLLVLAVALTLGLTLAANSTRRTAPLRGRTGLVASRQDRDEDYFEPSPGHTVVTTPRDELSGPALNAQPASCVCVPYYQCDENQNVNEDGVGIIDIRIKEGQCEHYLDYCCKLKEVRPNPLQPTDPDPTPSNPDFMPEPFPNPSPTPDPAPYPDNPATDPPPVPGPVPDYPHPTPPPQVQVCGQRNPEGIGFRITGGEDGEAQFGEFPWMVAILQEERIDGQAKPLNLYQCGGALITPIVVLTGAHCVAGKSINGLKIRAGEWDTQTTKELYAHQDRGVAGILVHPRFNPKSLHNDVALLTLLDPVQLGGHIGLVCLPDQDQIFDYKRCFASGWGKDKFEQDGQYQVILKKRDLPIVPNPQCQELLRKTRLGAYFLLDASFICAGGEQGRDTCKGDGGSPLVCPSDTDPNRYYQAGIVAWGIDCGLANTPGVYASVSRFRNWIDSTLSSSHIDTSGYQL